MQKNKNMIRFLGAPRYEIKMIDHFTILELKIEPSPESKALNNHIYIYYVFD